MSAPIQIQPRDDLRGHFMQDQLRNFYRFEAERERRRKRLMIRVAVCAVVIATFLLAWFSF